MLLNLHVKNLALIGEEEVDFGKGLNILSGETGAGKSIILGALKLALGEKVPKDFLRDPETEALVEAVFEVTEQEEKRLNEIDIDVYDRQVILTRKISATRATARINGESVPAGKMKEAGAVLLDIYGQHEHQSLLDKASHIRLLDEYAGDILSEKKNILKQSYLAYQDKKSELEASDIDENERNREMDFLHHEISEIESANLKEGEDESLENEYKRLSNSNKIREAIAVAKGECENSDGIGRAIRALKDVGNYSKEALEVANLLSDAEDIIGEAERLLSDREREFGDEEEKLYEVETRLNEVNRVKEKYSDGADTIDSVLEALSQKQDRLQKLETYGEYLDKLRVEMKKSEESLYAICEEVSMLRTRHATRLAQAIKNALKDLNFNGVEFEISVNKLDNPTSSGWDDVIFMISTNPGEAIRPLQEVASGGELSRVMLAIKTIRAAGEENKTLIFDEIDAGISGRTAAAVSEKLNKVSRENQVICITHLPQIAAMADKHFLIEKSVNDDRTVSRISALDDNGSVEEIARMLAGASVTESAYANAKELKENAECIKNSI